MPEAVFANEEGIALITLSLNVILISKNELKIVITKSENANVFHVTTKWRALLVWMKNTRTTKYSTGIYSQ